MAEKTKKPSRKKKEAKEEVSREYIIPLRAEFRKVPRYRRTSKAIKAIREFLVRHMKIRDRDLSKIKIDSYLNEFVWARGIKNPPHKIKIKATKEEDLVKVELVDYPDKLKFKKKRAEKEDKAAEEISKKKKEEKKENEETSKKEEENKKEEEKPVEEEKKAAVVEAGQELAKAQAKQARHQSIDRYKPKHEHRKALAK